MTNSELETLIRSKFSKYSDFIKAFNETAGIKLLDKTVLSAQLLGKRELSNGWIGAYQLFFKLLSEHYQNTILHQQNNIKENTSIMTNSIFRNKNYQIVCNHQIHEAAGMGIHEFLDRIKHVEYLRAEWNHTFSFYPTSKEEYQDNINLWKYVNGKRNALNDHYYKYTVAIPKSLYYFLRHSKRSQIFRPVLLGLASHYALYPKKRTIMEDQLYDSFYEKAVVLAEKYFGEFLDSNPESRLVDDVNHEQVYWQKYRDALDNAIKDYIGPTTLFDYIDASKKTVNNKYQSVVYRRNEFDISCPTAYMTESDWKNVILEGATDDLNRVESDKDAFELWKNDLGNYHLEIAALT